MDLESIRQFCLRFSGASEEFPFDADTLVFKVHGKIFALTGLAGPPSINLKCDPERAIELREHYEAVRPGYHMNKKHWNTVDLNGQLPDDLIKELITHSYNQVVRGLPKKLREKTSHT